MKLYAYCRVSTERQSLKRQIDNIKEADQSDILIAYVRSSGGAAKTMKYAKRKNKNIVNLANILEVQ